MGVRRKLRVLLPNGASAFPFADGNNPRRRDDDRRALADHARRALLPAPGPWRHTPGTYSHWDWGDIDPDRRREFTGGSRIAVTVGRSGIHNGGRSQRGVVAHCDVCLLGRDVAYYENLPGPYGAHSHGDRCAFTFLEFGDGTA